MPMPTLARPLLPLALVVVALVAAGPPAGAASTVAGDLPRSAELGFAARPAEGSPLFTVTRIDEGSPAAAAGLLTGDLLVAIGGETYAQPYEAEGLLERPAAGEELALRVRRDGAERTVTFVPGPRPLEEVAGLDSHYGVLKTADGARLRTIVTRPEGATGRLPGIFFVQWVSCGSIELSGSDPTSDLMRGVAERSGAVMFRLERAGSGDSEGPPCHALDYDTEVAHYREALDQFAGHPWVEPGRIVVWGSSLGSTIAPLLAAGRDDVAGVAVAGGGAVTYFERMLAFDRIGFERGVLDPREIHQAMLEHAAFHVEYLIRGKTPEEIAREHPELAGVWGRIRGADDGAHYGRPYAWHQQAARKDFLSAWLDVRAPVLVLYSEYDQFEAPHGHEVIVETINEVRPGTATLVVQPKMGHSTRIYPTADHAARWELGTNAAELEIDHVLRWLREVVGVRPTSG